jgi:hypothetical protein
MSEPAYARVDDARPNALYDNALPRFDAAISLDFSQEETPLSVAPVVTTVVTFASSLKADLPREQDILEESTPLEAASSKAPSLKTSAKTSARTPSTKVLEQTLLASDIETLEPTVIPVSMEEADLETIETLLTQHNMINAVAPLPLAGVASPHVVTENALSLWRTQNEAFLGVYAPLLGVHALSDVVLAQTRGVRQSYEAIQTHWREISRSNTQVLQKFMRPFWMKSE